jgi:hypothetical protein
MLNFLILGIAVIWCYSFTKLTGAEGKCTADSLLTFLFYFIYFYLLFYSYYILRRWLRTTRQTTSSITSSLAPEEARPVATLGTTKRRCLHICTLWCCMDVILSMDVLLCMDVMNIVMFEWMCWILWCLNECVEFGCTVYCVCKLCRFYNSSCAGYTIFCNLFKTQTNLRRLEWAVVD